MSTPRRPASREQIIDEALALTREHGLYGWSMRDLVARLHTSNSVVYDRVGNREALCRVVVEQIFVAGAFTLPDPALAWQEWFAAALLGLRDALVPYPGVARWLSLHGGPLFPGTAPDIAVGVGKLRDAGFGGDTALAFSAIMSTAMSLIMQGDDRLSVDDDGPHDHAHIIATYDGMADGVAGLQELRAFTDTFTGGPERIDATRRAFFAVVTRAVLDGLAARLPNQRG